MKTLDNEKRITTFEEVNQGLTYEEMIVEAKRCLNCKTKPCSFNCPVNIDIPKFVNYLKNENINNAYITIKEQNSFAGICSRVCPQENQCEGACVLGKKSRPLRIGLLERFASDNNTVKDNCSVNKNGFKVCAVGSGPASLSFASEALKLGFDVTIYEALHDYGGVLRYGIPSFRLPKNILDKEIDDLRNRGVSFEKNIVCEKTITINELKEKYDAIFVGAGAGLPRFMNIEGENYNGVMSANEFLTRVNLMNATNETSITPLELGKKVVVVGGGNVAMDAARCALRLGCEVIVVYRRTLEEMPARKEEVLHAKEEGVIFNTLSNPKRIIGNDDYHVIKIECNKMILEGLDEKGRRNFKVSEEAPYGIECDTVIMAIGGTPNPLIKSASDLSFSSIGTIITNEKGKAFEKIYAGGDIVTGSATVISAMGAGKKAAQNIYEDLKEKKAYENKTN